MSTSGPITFNAMPKASYVISPSVPHPQTAEQVAEYLYKPGVATRFWTFTDIAEQCDNVNEVFGRDRSSNHRRIAHGLDVIVLELREVLTLAVEYGRATQVMTAQALHGDAKAIRTFEELALEIDDEFALKVLALLEKLLALAAQVEVLVTELPELTAELSAPHFDDAATRLTNELLHGSMDRNAPPIRALRERGERSGSVVAEEFAMS